MDGTSEASQTGNPPAEDAAILEKLPREVGVLLLIIGLGGILLPGPIGSPFLVFGGVVLFPKTFRKWDRGMQKRFPKAYHESICLVKRFVDDLEHRYPSPT